MKTVDVFNRVPFLFARLGEAGVKLQCEAQFESRALEYHDRATLRVMGPDGELKQDFDALEDGGANMTVALQREVTHTQLCFDHNNPPKRN